MKILKDLFLKIPQFIKYGRDVVDNNRHFMC
jgi:hypothetical protein